ncbi:unnamed protein product [Phytomonas sp. EM1]|nr:unnamed protein product [Phytomonas sp. EM1]|eukprot:CCW59584.1 unnamed protein product [Phytomonas sp. isolate EM1]
MHPQSSLYRRRDAAVGGDRMSAAQTTSEKEEEHQIHRRNATARTTQSYEQENDELVKALLADVKRTKSTLMKIGGEVQRQNSILDTMGKTFGDAKISLGRTIKSLSKIGWSSFSHIWVLFLFVVVFFLIMYVLLKIRK